MKRNLKNYSCMFFVTCVLLSIISTSLCAQNRKVSGTVYDENQEPMIGVTVKVDGTQKGTVTDLDGKFSIDVPSQNSHLNFSFVGYRSTKVAIGKQTVLRITMNPNVQVLEDVVVIGYGTASKRDLTGAVSSVAGKIIEKVPIANVASALAGRMAGVQVTTSDGAPGADVKIRIRGGGSITQDNSPLYIVDGFPVDNINNISSFDIQSIDILKDASSTAIYGARGANGVVLITTKSAQGGKTIINYNGYAQMKYIPETMDMMNAYEFVALQNEIAYVRGGGPESSMYQGFVGLYGDPSDFDIYKSIPTRDYQDEMYGRTAWGQSHNLSVTGGTNKTKFNLSVGYLDEDGVLLNSGYQRTNLNFKLNHELYKNLRADLVAYYSNQVVKGAGTSGNTSTEIRNAVNYRPITGKGALSGDLSQEELQAAEDIEAASGLYDPITLINQDYKEWKRMDLNVNAALSWDIVKHLTLRSEFGIMTSRTQTHRFYGPQTWTARNAGGQPVASISNQDKPKWRTAHTLTYNIKNYQGKHTLSLMGGFEAMSEEPTTIGITARNLPIDITSEKAFSRMSFGSKEFPETTSGVPNKLASFFGRANYILKDKYLFSATVRADGSTKFKPGSNQWGIFPSGAVAWRLSEEDFLKSVEVIDNMKLRFSYGHAGNNRISDDMWRRTFQGTFNARDMYAGMGNSTNLYYANLSNTLSNPDIKWETTITRNLGLDFGFFDSRLSGTIEAYWNTTKDLLINSPIPPYMGYGEQISNVGQTSNRGLEISLNGVLIDKKDFNLSVSFNIGFNKNKVDKLDGASEKFYKSGWIGGDLRETDDYILKVGEPVGLMYGYITDGFYTVDDFEPGDGWVLKPGVANSQGVTGSYGGIQGSPAVGSLKLKKLTPIDPNNPSSANVTANDRTIIGNANPKHTGGFGISTTYKGLDFAAFFNWVYGNDVYNAQKIMNNTAWKYQYYNLSSEMKMAKRFTYIDERGLDIRQDKTLLKEMNEGATMWSPLMWSPVFHSWAVEDGSFLRLSNLTIGYTLPNKLTRKIGISKLRLYATGNNLFVWTKYSGFDPEVDTRTSTPLTPGVDYSAYPKARSFTFGTNITF